MATEWVRLKGGRGDAMDAGMLARTGLSYHKYVAALVEGREVPEDAKRDLFMLY